MVTIAGAILAGGAGSRFGGKPKGLLEFPGGETFIERISRAMTDAGIESRVICSADEESYAFLGLPVIPDLNPGCGPLGGIESALCYFEKSADAVLFAPCDTPNVGSREMKRLCERFRSGAPRVAIAETADGPHALCCAVRVDMRDTVAQAVLGGRRRPLEIWDEACAARIRFEDADRFFNVNSPADYERAARLMGGPRE